MEQMNWYEAKEYLCNYNKKHGYTSKGNENKCTMVAVISADSFDKEYSLEEIERCINRYSEECKDKEKRFILNESTFWNGRYIDYLTEHIEDTVRIVVYYENIDFIEVMEKEKMLSEEVLASAINITSEMDRADFTAEFMDRKMRLYGRKKKVFDL